LLQNADVSAVARLAFAFLYFFPFHWTFRLLAFSTFGLLPTQEGSSKEEI
jgi:hypothetical protein